ncbi:MAG: hypothetical protein K2Q32_08755 [Alphaproteobacteria bacterium]|nr:hypothetical protein [Alphaproteobacteria bacterium]
MWKPPTSLNNPELKKNLAKTKKIGRRLARIPLVWAVLIIVVINVVWAFPGWQRKNDLNDFLKSGQAGLVCLSHVNGIFEGSTMYKAPATTKSYIRFDRETFIKDFLKRDDSIKFMAVAIDFNGNAHWAEMSEKEILHLSQFFKIELGTCIAAKDFHRQVPGTALVTNQ